MGEIADQIIDNFLNRGFGFKGKRHNYQSGTGRGMWRRGDGRIVKMSSMKTGHLRNALAYCEQHGNNGKAEDIRAELKRRGVRA